MRRRSYKKPFKGKDASQDGIVAALEAAGATVQDLCRYGSVPDLLVGYRGANYLIECKPAEGDKRQLNLNPKQVEWHGKWVGQVAIAHTPAEALAIIGATDANTVEAAIALVTRNSPVHPPQVGCDDQTEAPR